MKKLMIALGVVAMAAATQAASVSFKWIGATNNGLEADVASIAGYGNGSYGLGTSNMKKNGTWTYVMYLYSGDTLVGQSAEGTVGYKSSQAGTIQTSVTVNSVEGQTLETGTEYQYKIVITGNPQNDIKALGSSVAAKDADGTYDYTAAYVETTLTGAVTPISGTKEFTSDAISSWELKGVVFTEAVPEPTSGLLLLLGVAGLALKRRRA